MEKQKLYGGEFTLAVGCPLNCKYCPQEKFISRYTELFPTDDRMMQFDAFVTILNKIESNTGVAFTGMCEPFQNPKCARMIKYAYDKGYKIHLDTTLQGVTMDDVNILKKVEFANGIQLHLPDQEGNSHFIFSDTWLDVFREVNSWDSVTAYHCHGTPHEIIAREIKPDRVFSNFLMNRAGNLEADNLSVYEHKGEIVCQNSSLNNFSGWESDILPNGTMILCCMDYGMEHVLGNILNQEWDDIIKSEAFIKIEKGMDDDTLPILCRKCIAGQPRSNASNLEEINLRGPNAIRMGRCMSLGGGILKLNGNF